MEATKSEQTHEYIVETIVCICPSFHTYHDTVHRALMEAMGLRISWLLWNVRSLDIAPPILLLGNAPLDNQRSQTAENVRRLVVGVASAASGTRSRCRPG